jgi:hypothetical protein
LVTLCTLAVQQRVTKIINNCDDFGHTLLNVYVGLKCTTTPNQRLVTLCTYAVQQSGIKIMNNCDEFGHTLLNIYAVNICVGIKMHNNAKVMIVTL